MSLFSSVTLFSQVGINTENPKATLDIVASPGDNTKTDGIIAPRLTGAELKAKDALYTTAQKGAIIYATSASASAGVAGEKTININEEGFYYFDGAIWRKISAGTGSGTDTSIYTHNGTLTANRTVTMDGKNLSFSGNGNVGVGTTTPTQKLDVVGTAKVSKAVVGDTWTGSALNVKNNIKAEPILTLVGSDGTFKARVTDDGYLGIGTTSPTQKLDVYGNVRFRGVPEGNVATTDRVIVVGSDGTAKKISTSNLNNIGDVKYGFQTADHNGWFLLNGRSISSLPAANQAAANSLFTTSLPDARERVLKPKGSLRSIGGSNAATSVTILRSNLPIVNLTGTAASAGAHNHSIFSDNTTAVGKVNPGSTNLQMTPINSNPPYPYSVPGGPLKETKNTQSSGAHTHSVSVALNNATTQAPLSVSTEDAYLSVNVFIYLGQ